MCQYTSENGLPTEWHLVHLGSRAVGGAALVIAEATSVSPEGRISPDDSGIWSDKHSEAFKRITDFIRSQNSVPGIQLAHAGRKASTYSPWKGAGEVKPENGGWQTIAPSPIPFDANYPHPQEMTGEEIKNVIQLFQDAAVRSINAGFQVIEIHMAHGYLIHEFLSPISNQRTDEYGGSLANRCRLAIEVSKAIRKVIPDVTPLFARISATDWVESGWNVEQSVQLVKRLQEEGVDFIDCSSGGNVPKAAIPVGPGYQLAFAEEIKRKTNILTGGVGLITSPAQAEQVIVSGQADAVIIGRAMLRNPYWVLQAAKELNVNIDWPNQYLRAK